MEYEWKTIESAPKDGTVILLWGSYSYTKGPVKCGCVESRWDDYDLEWETPIGTGYGRFTHWCEIVPPGG